MIIVNITVVVVVVVIVVVVVVVVVEFQLNYKDTITECSMCILPVTVTNELNFKKSMLRDGNGTMDLFSLRMKMISLH